MEVLLWQGKNESHKKRNEGNDAHYLKENDISIKNGNGCECPVMRDMMSVILEDVLDEELNEELGLIQSTITGGRH